MRTEYTKENLQALIKSVEEQFSAHLTKVEEEVLAKSEVASSPLVKAEEDSKAAPDKEAKADEAASKKEDVKPEAKHEEKKEEGKDAAPAQERPDEKADSKEAPAESKEHAPAQEGSDNQEGHDYDDADMEHMHKMYASMSKGELKAHHDSVRRALDTHMEKCGDMSMAKSEDTKVVEVNPETIKVATSDEASLLKSELEAEKAKAAELKKNFDAVSTFLGKLLERKGAPAAKAITSMDVIAKSEIVQEDKTPTRDEAKAILNKKSADPLMKSEDRAAVNAFFLNDKIGINTISHLLK